MPAKAEAASRASAAGAMKHRFRDDIYFRSIIDTVPDAMIVIDETGHILAFSHAAEKMFGYDSDELIGENVNTLMPSPDRERHDGYLARYRATGEARIIGKGRVTSARRRDGVTFPIDLSIGEAEVEGARVFTGFIRDLTERAETTKRLHVLQAELAHVARISQMGTLATSIAHELNQPLAAITNYVDAASALLAQRGESEASSVRQALALCADEVIRAGDIIRHLREFIRHGETERVHARIGHVIEEAIALALADGAGAGVALSVRFDEAAEDVLADRVQIQQVLVNLLRNATEAMADTRSKTIEIATRATDGQMTEVVVADSGPGLEPRIARRLFQPFETTKPSGMGLGLSICHTIVDAHGGRIWAEPSPLGGTAFHFTLPRFETPEGS
jgi:two-component system sensor kinase FixL